jgi:serine/threonine-protein kinase
MAPRRPGLLAALAALTVLPSCAHTSSDARSDKSVAPTPPAGSPWSTDVSGAPLDAESSSVIKGLQAAGGWGANNQLRIDFSLEVLQADANTPTRKFTPTSDWFWPDCDEAPVPVPPVGALEGEAGYACLHDGDCHLIVADRAHGKLFEMWRASIQSTTGFQGGCLAVWDLNRGHPPSGRGEQCTSADAAGYPITPLLVNADEVFAAVQSGAAVGHALRFILPNSRIRHGVYLHPATHSTNATSGGPTLPPYGAHFRLRADYPLQSLPSDAARAIARALQRYGMFLADGGNIALTMQSDRFTTHKWADLGFDGRSLAAIQVTDFEMVDGGERIPYSGECARNP